MQLSSPLVSPKWLFDHIDHPRLVILDASMKPIGAKTAPPTGPGIPGSRVFDFDSKICDRSSPLPHMMPSAEVFEREVRELGVDQDSLIVAYDRTGVFSSPRARWMFKAMGHDEVAVLDGGLPAWIAAGYPTAALPDAGEDGDFVARPRPGSFVDADQVTQALQNSTTHAVLDARSAGRFAGREPEPREGLRSGHMPGAFNVPFTSLQAQGRMLPPEKLKQELLSRVRPDQTLIASCGSGVTACVVALAAELAGHAPSQIAIYDGSWSEWGLAGSGRPVTRE